MAAAAVGIRIVGHMADDFPSSPSTTGKLAIGTRQAGNFDTGTDVDWFAITLQAGQRYLFSLKSTGVVPFSTGYTAYALAMYDAAGVQVSRIQQGSYSEHPVLEFTAASAGTYYVAAGSLYGWYAVGGYEVWADLRNGPDDRPDGLSTGANLARDGSITGVFEVAGDRDWIRFEAETGVVYDFRGEGPEPGLPGSSPYVYASEFHIRDSQGKLVATHSSKFAPEAGGSYYLDLLGLTAGDYKIVSASVADDYLPTNATRGAIPVGAQVSGKVEYDGDVDRFRLVLEKDVFYTVTLNAAPFLYYLRLFDAAGMQVDYYSGNTSAGSMRMVVRAPESGEFYLDVTHGGILSLPTQQSYGVTLLAGGRDLVGDTPATAQAATPGTPTRGVLEGAGDVDVYRIALTAGERYALSLHGDGGKWEPLTLRLTGPDGQPLSFDMTGNGEFSIGKQFVPATSGDYYLAVGSGTFGARGFVLDAIPLRGDTRGPVLVASSHPDGASGVRVTDKLIALTFDEPVKVNLSSIVLRDAAGNAVTHDYSFGGGPSAPWAVGNQLFVKPLAFFQPGTYTLTVPHGALTDLAGNPYMGQERFVFSTVAPVDAGTAGADLLAGGKGLRIDGGAGIDTVQLPGHASAWQVVREAGTTTVRHRETGVADTLAGVERLLFSQTALVLDIEGNGGQAYRMYRAAFDRTPDLEGVGFWITQLDRGLSLNQVAAAFIGSAEFQGLYGTGPGDRQFIELLYRNVLHRQPEDGGFAFWLARLDEGIGRERVLAAFSESDENVEALQDLIGNGFDYLPY